MSRIHSVDFSDVRLTDEQLQALIPSLRDLGGIRSLRLRNTHVGDRGLQSLTQLNQLYLVDVTGARATEAGIAKLRVDGVYPNVVDNSGPRAFEHRICQDLLFSPDARLVNNCSRSTIPLEQQPAS